MKKLLLIIVPLMTLIMFGTVVFAETTSFRETSANEVKNTIEKYFNNYFQSFVELKQIPSDDFIEDNENTYLYQKMHALHIEFYKTVGLGYETFKFDVEYTNLLAGKKTARAKVLLNLDYRYKGFNTDSGIYRVEYNFNLRHKCGKWFITKIDTNFDEFDYFKNEVKDGLSKNPNISTLPQDSRVKATKEIIDQVYSYSLEDLEVMNAQNNESNSLNRERPEIAPAEDETTGVKPYATTVSYNNLTGVSYAQKFTEAPVSARLFYTANSDCTNFVSQCIWAAYGGYVSGNDTQTKSNISNKFRMINGGYSSTTSWFAGTGGGSPNWESVDKLWIFTTYSLKYGPQASGYNNNGYYSRLSPSNINSGNVLQFYNSSEGKYSHSVYVTYKPFKPTWNNILVCQHSNDKKDRPLAELIQVFGGSYCKMRHLVFSSAGFDK